MKFVLVGSLHKKTSQEPEEMAECS